jgi:Zn-dependent protease
MNGRKAYYSFHDIPFDGTGTYNSLELGMRFSQGEIVQILIAMFVLTISFAIAFAPYPPWSNLNAVVGYMPLTFLSIVTAFVCHEIAHKYMGQKYGYWSEFRMYPQGLLFALFLSVTVGFVFAAPGAVQIFGNPSKENMGRIAAAGPSTNLTISVIFFLIMLISGGYLRDISFFIAYINAFLAFFNLLPFGPMDGIKIFRWRKEVWVLLIALSIGIFISLMA